MDHMYYHVTMEGKFPSIIWDSDLSCLITSDSCYYFWINISGGTLRRNTAEEELPLHLVVPSFPSDGL